MEGTGLGELAGKKVLLTSPLQYAIMTLLGCNAVIMDVDIKFCKSAFIHGYTEADIRLAIDSAIYDGYLEGDEDAENKRLLVGFDRKGNPMEIYYNILDKDTVRVFHAMEYRNIHNKLLENEE
jgi:hypothetical protein